MDCSPLGSSVCGIFQARILEWLPFSPGDLSPPGNLHDPGIEPKSSVCVYTYTHTHTHFIPSMSLNSVSSLSAQITCASFLQPWLYRNPSASFQSVFSENCFAYRYVFMFSWGEVSSMSLYSTVLIALPNSVSDNINELFPSLFFRLCCAACGILVPWPGIEPLAHGSETVKSWRLDHQGIPMNYFQSFSSWVHLNH